jgi:hypothetical protein
MITPRLGYDVRGSQKEPGEPRPEGMSAVEGRAEPDSPRLTHHHESPRCTDPDPEARTSAQHSSVLGPDAPGLASQ